MTVESELNRIGNLLEQLLSKGSPVPAPLPAADKGETVKDPQPEVAKPKRGRPAKITAEEKETATDAEFSEPKPEPFSNPKPEPVDEEDFLTEAQKAPSKKKETTIDDVRSALQKYIASKGEKGRALAKEILEKYGKGATRLGPAKDTPNDLTGVLKPESYDAVIAAAGK